MLPWSYLVAGVLLLSPDDGIIPFQGTLVSGLAGYRPAGGNAPVVGAPGVQIYCASGRHEGELTECRQIWGADCTAGTAQQPGPRGLFHFYHPDKLQHGISLLHRLDETSPCSDPGAVPGRYFSRFYTPRVKDRGLQVKATFVLHPTYQPFPSAASAAEQIAEVVAVRYFCYRYKIRSGDREQNEQTVRKDIEEEVAIILDSLGREGRQALVKELRERLSKRRLRDDEGRVVEVSDWLPRNEGFWLEQTRRWDKEREHWQRVPAPR